jgi:predicted nuclease of predicted toxin-antitoxin system
MPTQSPNPARLYLNENIPPRLAGQLRGYGFDVVSSQEAQMLSQDDEQQMAWAASEQRAIVTFNFADFVVLHEKYLQGGRDHFGIVLSTEEKIGILLRRLLRLLKTVSADELKSQLRWLNEFK